MEKIMEHHSEFDLMNIINLNLATDLLDDSSHSPAKRNPRPANSDTDRNVLDILHNVIPVQGDGVDSAAAAELWSLLVLGAMHKHCRCHCEDASSGGGSSTGDVCRGQHLDTPDIDITSHLAASVKNALKAIHKKRDDGPRCHLTAREREVLKWIGRGKSTWEISVILERSESVIKWHVKNLLQKLSAVNRPQAVAIAVRQGLID